MPQNVSSNPKHTVVCDVGRMPYAEAWELQQKLQARLIAAKQADPPVMMPNVFLLVEHPHVYTLGKNGQLGNLLLNDERLKAVEATFFQIDRGGDITYHGPGQLVGYPILDLDRFFTDLGKYLRLLEEVIIQACADLNITGDRVAKRTGVWVGPDDQGPERKICALGIRVSRWVTMHGFALNLNTDLQYFSYIVPCGIVDRGVTSVAQELKQPADEAAIRMTIAEKFSALFEAPITYLQGDDARQFLAEASALLSLETV